MAYSKREHITLAQIGEALSEHRRFENVGAYYTGLAAMRSGKGDLSSAQRLLEQAADCTNATYRAKALLSLGALAWYQGDFSTESRLYADALALDGVDFATRLELNRAVAFNYTLAGEYHSAIKVLEKIAPVARAMARVNPRIYYDLLNNYAVNLCEVGRLREALFYASITTASALARHIPEWRETKTEIETEQIEQEARPVIVVVPSVRNCAQGRKGKQEHTSAKSFRSRSKISLSTGDSEPPAIRVLPKCGKTSIQSRLRHSFSPHAPPFSAGK